MALCSSSRNPVGLFSKHIQNDRSLHKDRLVSKQSASREGLREAAYKRGGIIEDEFTQFNDRQNPITQFEQQRMILDLDVQSPSRTGTKSNILRSGWISEYNRVGSSPNGELRSYNHGSNFTGHVLPIQTRRALYTEKEPRQQRFTYPVPQKDSWYKGRSGFCIATMSNNLQLKEVVPENQVKDSDWEAAFSQLELANKPEGLPQNFTHVKQLEGLAGLSSSQFGNERDTQPTESQTGTEYILQRKNPFHSSHNPLLEGMDIVHRNGNLAFAALAFEAATVQDSKSCEAWTMLGTVLADNEQEGKAILALKKAMELGSDNPTLPLRLAICYTNEGNSHSACDILEEWLKSKYPQVAATAKASAAELPERFPRLKELYIRAAQLSPTGLDMDPNVQIALGILFFSTQEYGEAADCFAAAITCTTSMNSQTDQLHLLYNHYGACLGNISQHGEAISAYRLALDIKPNYTRARYNLGIAHLRQGDPKAGAQCLVQRLHTEMMHIVKVGTSHGRLQEMSAANEEDNKVTKDVYEGLRRCCYEMCRWDLAEKVRPGMDLRAFERELDF